MPTTTPEVSLLSNSDKHVCFHELPLEKGFHQFSHSWSDPVPPQGCGHNNIPHEGLEILWTICYILRGTKTAAE